MDLTCNGKFDGKDHPCSGPTLGPGWTASFTNAGPRALDMTVKNNGKALFKLSYSVSADGKTLTENGTATGPNEKTKVVYDKQ
jgi:DNA gyrase/topoisomerase IV subunit B